jgi:cytochrome P450
MSSDAVVSPPGFDPYDYAVQEDPYPAYEWLRTRAPLYWNQQRGFWALSRHADVTAAERNESVFSNSYGVTIDQAAWGPNAKTSMSFLAMDPPDQTRLRSLVSQGFTPRRIAMLEPRIRELTNAYLDEIIESGPVNMVDAFNSKLPMDVISEMVGVPVADRAELRRQVDIMIHRPEGAVDVPQKGIDAALQVLGYYGDLVAERRRRPADDLVSVLVQTADEGDRLSDSEIVSFLFLMVNAGNETTSKLLGSCLYWAHRNPGQLASVYADPARVPLWIEETLRYDTPVQLAARYLLADVTLHGMTAPAGSQLVLLSGAANRDPDVFANPDVYDLDRDTSQLVSFGGGRHYCLGANLARLEARIALTELINRTTGYDIDEAQCVRVHSVNVRGFTRLPITLNTKRVR